MKKLIIGFGGVGLNFLQGQKELLGEHFALVGVTTVNGNYCTVGVI